MKKYFPLLLLLFCYPLSATADLCKGVLLRPVENCGKTYSAGEVLERLHPGRATKKHQPKSFEQQSNRCPFPAKAVRLVNCHLIKKPSYPYYDMVLDDMPPLGTPILYEQLYHLLTYDAGFSANKAGDLARGYLRDPNSACSRKIDLYLSAHRFGRPYPQLSWMREPCALMPSVAAYERK